MAIRWILGGMVTAVFCVALAFAPAAQAQEERRDPQDVAASGSDMLQRSDLGNVAQAARLAYGTGERELKRAEKLTAKLADLEGDKAESTRKRITAAYEKAQGSFREALGSNPKMIEAYVGLGRAFRAQGMHRESLQTVTQGLRVDPANDLLFAGWAESVMGLDRLGDATEAYAQLLETNPPWAAVLMGAIKGWLVDHQADAGELDPADVEKMAEWVVEQEATDS